MDIAFFCFKHLGFTSFDQVDLISLAELDLAVKVVEEKQLDKIEALHFSAWLGLKVKGTTGGKNPKYKYNTFKKFFDREKAAGKADYKESLISSKLEYLKKRRSRKLKRKEGEPDE